MSHIADLQMRLDALPRKVGFPLRQLLAGEQVSEDVLSIILDAGDLSGETSRLLGFSVGFLHLASQGVPIRDVIRMAKHHQRRINLGWSAKRWKQEHDRLSRLEALARLARENVRYDVAPYETLLPEQFDGYLIRTSRRLGMEGLRQRHCVASYHNRLQAGSCAIASVFVHGQRWTVELGKTGNPEQPLAIRQIKTRCNAPPSGEIREHICEMLGIDPVSPPAAQTVQQPDEHSYMDNLRTLLPVLREHAVENIWVSFDGSGDSGSIEDISYSPHEVASVVRDLPVQHMTVTTHWEDGRWVRVTEPAQVQVNEAIDQLTYDYLEETGVDWYNDDGGFGELTIDVASGTVSMEVNVRSTHSNCEFHSERNIVTGEEA